MKRYFLLLCVLLISLSACDKGTVAARQADVDDAKIQAYIKANGLTMIKDPSGIYYQIITPGTGSFPTATSTVKVAYTGFFLNGNEFDSSQSASFVLTSTVSGFTIALQHINTGGRIRFIVPSALGYGAVGVGSIPANACLVYTLDMLGFF